MTKPSPTPRPTKPSEQGFGLLAVIFLVALLTIWLAIALPKISKQLQRDRELETMNRGKQYARAVRMYYKKFGAYPTSVDALVKPTNNIRFLRKKYTDPITGKDDWKPVLQGRNKAPLAMGFFGKPLGGAGAGCGSNPLATNALSGAPPTDTTATSFAAGTSGLAAGGASDCLGTGLASTMDTSTAAPGTPPTDPNAANAAGTTAGTTTGSTTGLTGQTFGGGPIMGFSPNSPKQSIMIYKTKNHYNEWEFVYSPLVEQLMMQAGMTGAAGQPINGSGFGSGSGSGTGSSPPAGGTNTGGAIPAPPPPPQQ